jgi:hypothetical protein
VTLTFWAIYAIDRELIFPRALDVFYPAILNHQQHTAVAGFVLLELVLARRPRHSVRGERTLLLLINAAYLTVIIGIWYYSETWVYPILNVLPWAGRIAFFAGSVAFVLGIHAALMWFAHRFMRLHPIVIAVEKTGKVSKPKRS